MASSRFPGYRALAASGLSALSSLCSRFAEDRRGTTAIEYGLVAVGISIAVIATVTAIGTHLEANYFKPVQAMFGQ